VRLLLDTQVALWAVTDSPALSGKARQLILDADEVHVSVASVWEIAIKRALPRGDMPVTSAQAVAAFEEAGYLMLPVKTAHVLQLENLPALHADPFDRLLVAQALSEPLTLLTGDRLLASYSSTIVRI